MTHKPETGGAVDGKRQQRRRWILANKDKWRAQRRRRYARHRDTLRAQRRAWYAAHREQIIQQQSAYNAIHKSEKAEYDASYRVQKKHRRSEQNRIYAQQNSDVMRAKWRRRRARKSGQGGDYSRVEWQRLCASWGNKCLCCGSINQLTADHIVPLSRGGKHQIDNLQLLCQPCNNRKYTRTIDYRPYPRSSAFVEPTLLETTGVSETSRGGYTSRALVPAGY